jgi:serine/threonine protein kinase
VDDGEDVTQPSAPGARPLPLHVGQRVRDYVVEELIARGGFGTVYRARHAVLNRAAAIKVLHADLVSGESLVRFHREAQVVNDIKHPNIVDIFDVGELPGGVPYFLMELLGGKDLGFELATRGRFAPKDALEILHPLAAGLAAAHLHGVIHRDVKASNVVIDPGRDRGRVVLLDFGVAKLLDSPASGVTATRQLVGSPCCNAPEQIEGRTVDPRTDVYGLAVLAFQLLTGELPFRTDEVGQLQHLVAPRPRASTRARLAPAVDAVLARGMAIAPPDRHAGTQQLVADLADAIARHAALDVLPPVRRPVDAIVVRALAVGDLDEDLVHALAAIDRRSAEWLAARGFALVRERPGEAVHLRIVDERTPADVDTLARGLAALLHTGAPRTLRVTVTARRGEADLAGDALWSGPLVDDA